MGSQCYACGRRVKGRPGRQAGRQARNVGVCLGAEASERKQQRDDDHAKSEGKCEVSGDEVREMRAVRERK